MLVIYIFPIIVERYKWAFPSDPTPQREAGKKEFESGALPRFLGLMLSILNQGKGKFMTGDDVSTIEPLFDKINL